MLNIIIEIASLLIFFQTDYNQNNFTEFATKYPLVMLFYAITFSYLIIDSLKGYYSQKYLNFLGIIFSLSMIIPYHIHPIINELHTFFALIPIVVILFLIYKINNRYQFATALIAMISIYLYIRFGIINSIIELIVITYTNIVCYLLKSSSRMPK